MLLVVDGGTVYRVPELGGRYLLVVGGTTVMDISHEEAVQLVRACPVDMQRLPWTAHLLLSCVVTFTVPAPGLELPAERVAEMRELHGGAVN